MKKHYLIWLTTAKLSIQSMLENRLGVIFFTTGKVFRFLFFLFFLILIHQEVQEVSGYTLRQMIVFFLIFNIVDLFGQIFFRGIYWFRQQVISGEFDFRLVKPANPLFQALTRQTDILDIPMLLLTLTFLFTQGINATFYQLLLFTLVLASGFLIITAIHIAVAALGVITTEVDHTIMIYRDLSQMARVPVDIYTDTIRALLTFVIPVAIAYTLPAKTLLGIVSLPTVAFALIASCITLAVSLKLWHYALTQYSSASS